MAYGSLVPDTDENSTFALGLKIPIAYRRIGVFRRGATDFGAS